MYDLIAIPGDVLFAVAGNGSDSDGVYRGKIIAIAKIAAGGHGIDTKWGFTFQQRHPLPTAAAFAPLDGSCIGRVYVGNRSGVASGLLCDGSLGELAALPSPDNPFGLSCASMIVYSVDNMLYAGGNNDFSNASTVAPSDTSWLIRGTTELKRFKRLNVTSLVEFRTQREILVGNAGPAGNLPDAVLIAAATVDSGIKLFEGDYLYRELPSPVHGEPVVSIIPFTKVRTFTGFTLTMLVAATPSGVFLQCSPDENCIWKKIGELPSPPKCLAQYNGATLWAGTNSGVYRHDVPTASARHDAPAAAHPITVSAIRGRDGVVNFHFRGDHLTGAALDIFDLRGRCMVKGMRICSRTAIPVTGRGVRLYRVMKNGRYVTAGSVAGY